MAPHSSTLAWKIPWTEEPGRLQSMGSLGVWHDWAISLSLYWLRQSIWLSKRKLWKILKEMGIPGHLTCLLRSLYAGQETTVRTGHESFVPFCFLSLECYHLHIWSCCFSCLSWFQLVLHPAWHFVWCILWKLNKQGDNIQPWHTPFPIRNQSIIPCWVLTVASWPAYRFLRRQARWSCIPISLRIFHSMLWSIRQRLWHSQ